MDTSTIIWIIVIVVIVLILLGLLASMMGKRRKERDRGRAEEIRTEATGRAASAQDSQLQAQQAEAEAERKRIEAERAATQAAEARQGADVERARHEDQIREADRLDPDVDHKAADYEPRPLGESDHQPPRDGRAPVSPEESVNPPVADTNTAAGERFDPRHPEAGSHRS